MESLGASNSIHPEYSSYQDRLSTFEGWPALQTPTKELMAEAGFFRTYKNDHVLCFHCGIGLSDWKDDEDPWMKHALWTNECAYVVEKKGINYIRDAVVEYVNLPPYVNPPPSTGKQNIESAWNETSLQTTFLNDILLCRICYQEARNLLFLPCQHLVSCAKCYIVLKNLKEERCPVCREFIYHTKHVFIT